MGIKTSPVGKIGEGMFEMPKETTTNSSSRPRRSRRRQGRQPPIQILFNTCKQLFANGGFGFIPPPPNVQQLCSILDDLKPTDVGLTPLLPYFRTTRMGVSPTITYLHLHECEKFSIGIFCLPPSGVLPLHNHPGMTVFSKLLFGTMHIKSYDWVTDITPKVTPKAGDSEDINGATTTRLAKLKVDSDFTAPGNTSVLYPNDGGNMHCFTAVTPCAVLDVLTPPYSDPDGRHCTYYHEYPFDHFSVEGVTVAESEKGNYAWLKERERPEELVVVGGRYMGPKILKT
ncbi:hypothetical protein V2J09_003322 [Rumex salicifolius]